MKFVTWEEDHSPPYNSEPDKLEGELVSIMAKVKEEKIIADALQATEAAERAIRLKELAEIANKREAEDAMWAKTIAGCIESGLKEDEAVKVIASMRAGGFKPEQIIEVLNAIAEDRARKEHLAKLAEKEAVPKPEAYGTWA